MSAGRGKRVLGDGGRSLAWQALGSIVLAAGFGVQAQAGDAPMQLAANAAPKEVSGVVVTSRPGGLNGSTGLAAQPTTLQDTAQTANVISSLQLQQQKIVTLEQALRNVPGITVSIGEGGTLNGDQFRIRGQEAQNDIYLDGLRDFGVYARDSFNYQEVQVLKGPSGALFGRGTTGGVINVISKTAHMGDEASAEVSGGSADDYRGTIDVNHQLGENAALRINLLGNSNDVVDRDEIHSKRWGVAASLAIGLDGPTRFTFNYLHQHDDRVPDYGIIILQPPGQLIALPASEYGAPRSNFLGLSSDIDRSNANIFTARLSHVAGPWTLTSDARAAIYDRYFQYSTLDQCSAACLTAFFDGDPATEAYGGYGGSGPYKQNAWGLQDITAARYDGPLLGLRSELILGVDVNYQSNRRKFYAYTLPAGITARNLIPRPIVHPDPTVPAGYGVIDPTPANVAGTSATLTTVTVATGDARDYGGFATARVWLNPQWSILGSIREDIYQSKYDTTTVAGTYLPLTADSDLTDPRVSLLFEPSPSQTFYLSWGKSATPQGTAIVANATGIAATAADLEPEKNETYEAGVKLGLPGGGATVTAAAFYVKKNNATQTDPSTGFLQAQSGERQTIKGFELGLTGRLAPGWTVNAAYAYIDSRIDQSFSNCSATGLPCPPGAPAATPLLNTYVIGRQVLLTPKSSASLFTNYEFRDALKGLAIGGGVTYQQGFPAGYTVGPTGLTKIACIPYSLSADAVIAYTLKRYRLALNVTNLTDRLNYTQVFANRAVPAPGRTFIVSLGARF